TRSAGMENAGGYCGKKSVRDFVERRWRSNGGWMEATGCATGAAICTCGTAPKRCGRPQVLAAYGLQDLRNKHRNPKTKSNPNTMCLPNTLGEDLGSGHFYLAKNRTFLLCVDINVSICLLGLLHIFNCPFLAWFRKPSSFKSHRIHHQLILECLVKAVVSIGRCNTI